jgi:ABC-2 type transport system ATP-binding protein
MPLIEITHLSKYYGRSRGIEDISFDVRQGDIFGFIGPNGAGKSTMIRIMLNLIFPTSGSGRIFGLDMVKDSEKIRSQVGYVPSDANLYDRMKVHEFLKYSADFYSVQNSEQKIRELSDIFDLDPGRNIPELSMGNKKKVTILQALVHQPALLILDEPTTGLDPLIQARFFDLLHEENKNGTTIFFSSHNLSEVQAFCKTVAIIREGRIINVEEIAALRKKQLKRVKIDFSEEMKISEMELEGVELIEKETGKKVEFLFSGNINELISVLSGYKMENLSIEEPPLEEIFLHYYKKGGGKG